MFGNFIYFIVVLLVFATYQPSESPLLSPLESILYFLTLSALFTLASHLSFTHLEKRLAQEHHRQVDHRFNRLMTRHSIAAVLLVCADIYLLDIPDYLTAMPLLRHSPTLQGILVLSIFTGYLAIVWANAWRTYAALYRSAISRKGYILSNISFSVPILLPWCLLSGFADLLSLLPLPRVNAALNTPEGQVLYFLIFLVVAAIFGPVLIQKFWRCTPLPPGEHRRRIALLLDKAGLGYRDILYWPIYEGRMITAGVMGLIARFRYILVTESLLNVLTPGEIDAVIAHEIGHIKKKHLLFYLLFFVGYLLIFYALFELTIYTFLFSAPIYNLISDAGISRSIFLSTATTLATIALFLFYFRFILGYFMRNFERQADCFVYQLFPSARPLISTFEKIILTSGQAPDRPNWHHFSISERVTYLMRCEADRSWILRHDRKVRKSIALYLLLFLSLGVVGYQLNFGEAGKALSAATFENAIRREIAETPDDPKLYRLLGDLTYEQEEVEEAIRAYRLAIQLAPEDAHALNNLAWLLATADRPDLRDPREALDLALRAVRISDAPHVLDTLAECYFINGQISKAVAAGKAALRSATGDKSHYKMQLRKFQEAQFR